ncbi:MAG: Rieske (2Fe-2S) protein [Myxococcota bacterium]
MPEDRRTILKVLSGVLGGGAAAAVGIPAVRAVVSPLGKVTVSGTGQFVSVAKLDSVPDDGTPINVPVVIDAPMDAWNRMPPTTVGAVFLRKLGGEVQALSTVCPHLGCGIDYAGDEKKFACPCHESSFDLDGQVAAGPSPRRMDALETRIRDGQIEVKFEKFKLGTGEKVTI